MLGTHKERNELKDMKEIYTSKWQAILVSDEDYEDLSKHFWTTHPTKGYVQRSIWIKEKQKNTAILMHRYIMKPGKGLEVDHINGNKLDNRRENLRICTRFQNLGNRPPTKNNTSGYRGVSWCKADKVFRAKIKRRSLGNFKDVKMAAEAWNKAAIEEWGEFAYQNKI